MFYFRHLCLFCFVLVHRFKSKMRAIQYMSHLLEHVNPEVIEYITKYQQLKQDAFAVIKISGGCLQENNLEIIDALGYLHSHGLTPVIVPGWGAIANEICNIKGFPRKEVKGSKITSLDQLTILKEDVVPTVMDLFGDLPVEKIETGITAEQIPNMGLVGKVTGFDSSAVSAACNAGTIPVVIPLGYDSSGQLLNCNADDVAKEVTISLHPLKYVGVTSVGGIYGEGKVLLEKISLSTDYDKLISKGIVTEGAIPKLNAAKELIDIVQNGFSVQFSKPEGLLRELVTHHGTGTKVVRGHYINEHDSFEGINIDALTHLIETESGKKLTDIYYEDIPLKVFVEDDYDGVAIIKQGLQHLYIDKLYVHSTVQSNGLGTEILYKSVEYAFSNGLGISFRAANDNPNNEWYEKRMREFVGKVPVAVVPGKEFTSYNIGIPYEDLSAEVAHILNIEKTLVAQAVIQKYVPDDLNASIVSSRCSSLDSVYAP